MVETAERLIGDNDCEPCFERAGLHVKSARSIGGTRLCTNCINGNLPNRKSASSDPAIQREVKSPNTASGMLEFLTELMVDLRSGNVDPNTGNAICKAAGTMLTLVQMQSKYRVERKPDSRKIPLLEE